ncbi:GNAT family N-acetyltransferase [Leeia sp. TBRC 13508]|uniref:GNAT family N-acetyltransferase n=1 Tax=Leeia speluncae TaxID=2884804 RepID=A0ABS8D3W3_9NEIS|nr:GNAT family N-acetyltransferase [Leeia speluncae]MCB6182896.1 GNAT family N-acetyltransferase [Leeia speluncae]
MQLEMVSSIASVSEEKWNALAEDQPFLQHAFLHALETSQSVGQAAGWQVAHVTLSEQGALKAAMPLYLKSHSYGEYVFDWAWANACQQAGIPYYPKLLSAIPFTPVTGHRIMAEDQSHQCLLIDGVMQFAEENELSGWHLLFADDAPEADLLERGWLTRKGVQFHWVNRGYRDYEDFLSTLRSEKRKKLKQERKKAQFDGVEIIRKTGAAITPEDWQFFYRCYQETYLAHRSTPYLTPEFFLLLGEKMADNCLLVLAYHQGKPVAAALNLYDRTRLYGRYWGSVAWLPSLHFELCYHQGIEFAIERGLQVFEGGAQGEHKLARGFEAVETSSWHWLRHEGLSNAVSRFLNHERQGIGHYLDELAERAPFHSDGTVSP